jgi:uncharacterized protein YehS (DUF1456 family)
MTNNDVIRRLRFIFDFNDEKMMKIFKSVDYEVSRELLSKWLKKEEHPDYEDIHDDELAMFLNGLIIKNRGRREGPLPVPETRLSNNAILMKLKIALNLQSEDILEVFGLTSFKMSKAELGAIFRKPDHKHYRVCKDQMLRNFLKGLQLKNRPQ